MTLPFNPGDIVVCLERVFYHTPEQAGRSWFDPMPDDALLVLHIDPWSSIGQSRLFTITVLHNNVVYNTLYGADRDELSRTHRLVARAADAV